MADMFFFFFFCMELYGVLSSSQNFELSRVKSSLNEMKSSPQHLILTCLHNRFIVKVHPNKLIPTEPTAMNDKCFLCPISPHRSSARRSLYLPISVTEYTNTQILNPETENERMREREKKTPFTPR
jgi:hypothetical protein